MQTLRPWPIFVALLSTLAFPATAVEIDGRIEPAEWAGARHITDFQLTQPLSRAAAPQATEAWILSMPGGLAIGFRNVQTPDIPRTRQRNQRDNVGPQDRVNLYVDFDGDGRTGYNFVVALGGSIRDSTVTNENQFNPEWDGNWRHAASEDEAGWSAEMLIPWYIAPMRDGNNGTRTLGINLDRVIGATGERVSWPANTFTETRFLSNFARVQVPAYGQSLLAITPYVVGLHDAVGKRDDLDAGTDLFWKPNGRFQLSATLNPDFGQVESDELVVNFGATETFFSDRRPFFTENQSFFDVPFGSRDTDNQLIYTRRVGSSADDGSGAGDVAAAVKLNGSVSGDINYGVFAASEGDAAGRDFYAARLTGDLNGQGLGAMVTRVERPFLDRVAMVYEADHRWTPTSQWSVRTTVVGSDIDQAAGSRRDNGGQVRIDHDMGNRWRQQLYLLHLGRDLELNDFGFLERSNFNYGRYELSHRVTHLPKDSPYAAHDWGYIAARRVNDSGVHISDAFAVRRSSERRDGGNQYLEVAALTSGHNDLITRGNGVVKVPSQLTLFGERLRPRKGHWEFYARAQYRAEGLGGINEGATTLLFEPTYHANDTVSFFSALEAQYNPDWLLWRGGNLLGTFRSNQLSLNAGATWMIGNRQELRVRLEAIGLDAKLRQAYRIAVDGTPVPSGETIPDFGLRNLGFQVRYRYELAPLSSLYISYVRGGSLFEEDIGSRFDAIREFAAAFDLRDSEQLLVKLSYRFEI